MGKSLKKFNLKIKMHSSREIEYFVETHLCKLCVFIMVDVGFEPTTKKTHGLSTTPFVEVFVGH